MNDTKNGGDYPVKDYSAEQFSERVQQLHMLMKFMLTSSERPKIVFGIPPNAVTPGASLPMIPAERVQDRQVEVLPVGIERILPAPFSVRPGYRINSDLEVKTVKLFDISKADTSRHRFFLKSRSHSSQNESYQKTALQEKHF